MLESLYIEDSLIKVFSAFNNKTLVIVEITVQLQR